MKCTTTSGPYQCDLEMGHADECECTPPAYLGGPASDAARASLHMRAVLDRASTDGLDTLGKALGVRREVCEPDALYRERIWSKR